MYSIDWGRTPSYFSEGVQTVLLLSIAAIEWGGVSASSLGKSDITWLPGLGHKGEACL